jgi:hypothetical protein
VRVDGPGYATDISTAIVSRPPGAQLCPVSGLGVWPCASTAFLQVMALSDLLLAARLDLEPRVQTCAPSPHRKRWTAPMIDAGWAPVREVMGVRVAPRWPPPSAASSPDRLPNERESDLHAGGQHARWHVCRDDKGAAP